MRPAESSACASRPKSIGFFGIMRIVVPWLVWAGFFLSAIRVSQSEYHEPTFAWIEACTDFVLWGIVYTVRFLFAGGVASLALSLVLRERARRTA